MAGFSENSALGVNGGSMNETQSADAEALIQAWKADPVLQAEFSGDILAFEDYAEREARRLLQSLPAR
jgi:hypothetical protein